MAAQGWVHPNTSSDPGPGAGRRSLVEDLQIPAVVVVGDKGKVHRIALEEDQQEERHIRLELERGHQKAAEVSGHRTPAEHRTG